MPITKFIIVIISGGRDQDKFSSSQGTGIGRESFICVGDILVSELGSVGSQVLIP